MESVSPEEEEEETTSSESGEGQENTRRYNLRRNGATTSDGTEEQGLQINLAISSGLARLYSMLTQAEGAGGITLGWGSGDTDSEDEDYTPTFSCRRPRQSMPKKTSETRSGTCSCSSKK